MVERREHVACPNCHEAPWVGDTWICSPDGCGGVFDTFATGAVCPHCDARFTWTACGFCLTSSAHRLWYRNSHYPN
jgi:hypothetical protein